MKVRKRIKKERYRKDIKRTICQQTVKKRRQKNSCRKTTEVGTMITQDAKQKTDNKTKVIIDGEVKRNRKLKKVVYRLNLILQITIYKGKEKKKK